jgi:phage replication-related protein YjqB (UPF0714/DUF867 family)
VPLQTSVAVRSTFLNPKENGKLHIDSTGFDEPTFQELVALCDFVLSVHGANGKAKEIILVGGLYEAGKAPVDRILKR